MNEKIGDRLLVVVVGGGFGGLNVVQGLRDVPVRILLVDKRNHHLFQPLLYQVATASLSADNIATPIRKILRKQENVAVGLVELPGADLDQKIIFGPGGGKRQYDYLVIATGMEQAYFGHDEYKPFAPGLKDLNDAVEIRRRILLAFEEAEFELDEESRRGKLTFVVVGGGATGVELAGAIIETATKSIPNDFRFVDTRTARVILVEGGDHLLGGMPEEMGEQAQRDLEDMGVEIRLNSYVTAVDDVGVMIGEERVPAENVLWAAGVQGTSFVRSLGVEMDRAGRIKVGPDLSIPGHPEAFVVGDAAYALDAKTGQPVPGVAQGAIQMGQLVADIIRDDLEGVLVEDRPAFSYYDKGSMATIGRGKAVAWVNDRLLKGLLGWLAWGVVHVMFLVGYRNRITVMLEWVWSYFVYERGARLITGSAEVKVKEVRGIKFHN